LVKKVLTESSDGRCDAGEEVVEDCTKVNSGTAYPWKIIDDSLERKKKRVRKNEHTTNES
jgi:hypothetical protein